MSETKVKASASVIAGLLRMENGIRKAARIFLFMDRAAIVEILYELPPALIAAIAREMAKLKAQIQDFEEERRKIEQELGALSALIDLSPPNFSAAAELAFLDTLADSEKQKFAQEASLDLLAVVVANASPETAFAMTTALQSRFERRELTEAMTRIKPSDADWAGAARELAKSVRTHTSVKRRKPNTHVGLGAQTSISQAKSNARVRLVDPVAEQDGIASIGEAFSQVIDIGGRSLLQKSLASLADDLIAAAVIGASSAEGDALLTNLSRFRREEVSERVNLLEADQSFDAASARRQTQIFIGRLLKAAR